MKILILLSRWKGGVGTVIRNVKMELESKGNEVDVISREDDLNIKLLCNSIFSLRKKIKVLMTIKNYDIIYTQDWNLALPLLFPYPLYKSKHFCCFHGNQLSETVIIQAIIGRLMGHRLIVVGNSLKKRFKNSNKIYNGVDLMLFKPLKKKREYIGWIDKPTESISKEQLIDFSKIIGLKYLIAKDIPHTKMNEFYNKCKIFISLPPKSAGFNLSWIEALAAGVPIIFGNNEGIGQKLNINHVSSLEETVKIINEKPIRNANPKEARAWLKKKGLTWQKYAELLINLFNKNEKNIIC